MVLLSKEVILCQMVLSKGGEVIVVKEVSQFKGHYAVAIVTDRSHLYDADLDMNIMENAVS